MLYYSFLFAPALLSAVYSLIAVFRTEIIAVESNKGYDFNAYGPKINVARYVCSLSPRVYKSNLASIVEMICCYKEISLFGK